MVSDVHANMCTMAHFIDFLIDLISLVGTYDHSKLCLLIIVVIGMHDGNRWYEEMGVHVWSIQGISLM
jgi:hypothetical protein